jgi:hypothetical protein
MFLSVPYPSAILTSVPTAGSGWVSSRANAGVSNDRGNGQVSSRSNVGVGSGGVGSGGNGWGMRGGFIFLLHVLRSKMEYPALKRESSSKPRSGEQRTS